ncbi:MAG: hypothetical protein U9R42_09600 [Bacteroidota bacterium]|nr:hypothetical protein [Bacteroidota bacterium]
MARLYINDSLCFNDSESFEYIEIIDTIKFIIYNNVNYLFVPYRDRPDPNSWHIFVIENDILKEEKIIQADIGMNFKDYDNDGLIEFGGLPQFHEAYCFDCDSVYYNSNIIYEISDAILLDTMLSIENNKKYYGKHIDFSRGCYTVTSNEQK